MAKKRKTLPKEFAELIQAGDIEALKAVFQRCELDATGDYGKHTALAFFDIPDELTCWLVEQGADINMPDRYGKTPLHKHARPKHSNLPLFIQLGANIQATDYEGKTPLHEAASAHNFAAVQTLLAHGADVRAADKRGQTPLLYALMCCRNVDITPMALVAEMLLSVGEQNSPAMQEEVKRIGRDFEFGRDRFNPSLLNETEASLAHLYQLFEVPPVPPHHQHDGVSPITVTANTWQEQHAELWDMLIPAAGPAPTMQGEVIRITGRVSHEVLDNGGANWDNDFCAMLDALLQHLANGCPLVPIGSAMGTKQPKTDTAEGTVIQTVSR